jgi:hypothetical protein
MIINSSTTKRSYSLETPTNMQANLGEIDTLLNSEIEPSQSQLLGSKGSTRNDSSSEIQVNKTLIKIAKNS